MVNWNTNPKLIKSKTDARDFVNWVINQDLSNSRNPLRFPFSFSMKPGKNTFYTVKSVKIRKENGKRKILFDIKEKSRLLSFDDFVGLIFENRKDFNEFVRFTRKGKAQIPYFGG